MCEKGGQHKREKGDRRQIQKPCDKGPEDSACREMRKRDREMSMRVARDTGREACSSGEGMGEDSREQKAELSDGGIGARNKEKVESW